MHASALARNPAQARSPPPQEDREESSSQTAANPRWVRLATRAQAKLSVSAPDDPSEREADSVAEQVMRMSAPQVQRACSACSGTGASTEDDPDPQIQRSADGGGEPAEAADGIAGRLGSGRPLDPSVRSFFEPRYGVDFGAVRVHSDASADAAAKGVNALAFTLGRDVVFRSDQYAPHTESGRRLLAHELTHVVQQRGSVARVQREAACPARATGEVARSKTAGGILTNDVVFTSAARRLDVGDFPVNSSTLPAGATDSPDWQRAMSLMAGDPSIRIAVTGFTDCAGSDSENLDLRQRRAQAVTAAMPATARSKILFSFTFTTSDFLDTNATQEGRARNRAVRITFVSAPPAGRDPCDMLPLAHNLDEYLFLVRCLEARLHLTAATDTPTALSVLRQIYFGTESWSASENVVWEFVIPDQPWSPGTDPTSALHPPLMAALQASQVVEGTDIGHILTGIDAMMRPQMVVLRKGSFGLQTGLANEEWATWAGDVGSAAAQWSMDVYMGTPPSPTNLDAFFHRYAGDDDLTGDVDAFAMRAGGGGAATPPAQLMQSIALTGPLSNALLQYFRITSSALGAQRGRSARNFVEAYGGLITGKTLTNRPALVARLRPMVDEFARMYAVRLLLSPGPNPPPGAPDFATLIVTAIDAMTNRFVDWLVARI